MPDSLFAPLPDDVTGRPAAAEQLVLEQWKQDDTFGAVRYTNFATRIDPIVVPYTNAFQRSPGAVNVVIQQRCPLRVVEHVTLALDGTTYSGIQDALAGQPISLNCLAL